jgi:hypothetical protein
MRVEKDERGKGKGDNKKRIGKKGGVTEKENVL